MSDIAGVLVKAVVAALAADAALKALLGDPVRVFDAPPKGGVAPYLLIGRGVEVPLKAEGGGAEVSLSLSVVSGFAGQEEARAVVAVVRDVLDGLAVSEGGVTGNVRLRGAEVFVGGDGRGAYGILRLRAVMEG
ncbi:DUF3168 domain-containing protein [uncultured Brevundimonas sp.]|uniref:tail completion protein gp17 n=1 Tax=uncultured Brevundimonas sp. TaxID=213418 RepID=UPI002637B6A9|nr:DUF3168 domain-containing protein [uncultured Brevundimonas sp.]